MRLFPNKVILQAGEMVQPAMFVRSIDKGNFRKPAKQVNAADLPICRTYVFVAIAIKFLALTCKIIRLPFVLKESYLCRIDLRRAKYFRWCSQ